MTTQVVTRLHQDFRKVSYLLPAYMKSKLAVDISLSLICPLESISTITWAIVYDTRRGPTEPIYTTYSFMPCTTGLTAALILLAALACFCTGCKDVQLTHLNGVPILEVSGCSPFTVGYSIGKAFAPQIRSHVNSSSLLKAIKVGATA
jgi:hypothetical protein